MAKKVSRWRQVTTIHSFKDSKIVRVFGIARVSTDKQAKKIGESLDHQKEVLENWVRSKSSLHAPQEWKLTEIFVENEDPDGKRKGRTATKREGRKGLTKEYAFIICNYSNNKRQCNFLMADLSNLLLNENRIGC